MTRMGSVREIVTESALFYAYRNDPAVIALRRAGRETVKRPCACRGWIEADPVDPMPDVQVHVEGVQHQDWRRRREDSEEKTAITRYSGEPVDVRIER